MVTLFCANVTFIGSQPVYFSRSHNKWLKWFKWLDRGFLPMRKNIPGIHDEPAEEVGPRDVVHGILFGGYGPSDYLCI